MIEATVVLRPGDWVERISEGHHFMVKISDSHVVSGDVVRDLVELSAPMEDIEAAVERLRKDPSVIESDLNMIDRTRALGAVTSRSPARARLATIPGFVDAIRSTHDGSVEYSIYAREPAEVKRALKSLAKDGIKTELTKLVTLEEEALGPNAERILQTAFQRGFFDHPKRVGLKELGRLMNIDPVNLGEILREGKRKIIGSYLRGSKLRF